jgi:hypothetical protein
MSHCDDLEIVVDVLGKSQNAMATCSVKNSYNEVVVDLTRSWSTIIVFKL